MNKKLLAVIGIALAALIALSIFLWFYYVPPDFMYKRYNSIQEFAYVAKLGDLAILPIYSPDGTFDKNKPYGWAGNVYNTWTEITIENPKDPSVKLVKGKNLAFVRVKEHTFDNRFALELIKLKPA